MPTCTLSDFCNGNDGAAAMDGVLMTKSRSWSSMLTHIYNVLSL